MTQQLPSIKKGETFSIQLDYTVDGVGESFPSTDLKAQIRSDENKLIAEFTIAAVNGVPGRFLITSPTSTWPVGDLSFDVKRTSNGIVSITETVTLTVEAAITV